MVKTAHSDFEIDSATKQGEEGEISSQGTQPRYNQETERAIAQARAMMDSTQPSQRLMQNRDVNHLICYEKKMTRERC